jgi:hypothetical protein
MCEGECLNYYIIVHEVGSIPLYIVFGHETVFPCISVCRSIIIWTDGTEHGPRRYYVAPWSQLTIYVGSQSGYEGVYGISLLNRYQVILRC